jgi:hypothetical protein
MPSPTCAAAVKVAACNGRHVSLGCDMRLIRPFGALAPSSRTCAGAPATLGPRPPDGTFRRGALTRPRLQVRRVPQGRGRAAAPAPGLPPARGGHTHARGRACVRLRAAESAARPCLAQLSRRDTAQRRRQRRTPSAERSAWAGGSAPPARRQASHSLEQHPHLREGRRLREGSRARTCPMAQRGCWPSSRSDQIAPAATASSSSFMRGSPRDVRDSSTALKSS